MDDEPVLKREQAFLNQTEGFSAARPDRFNNNVYEGFSPEFLTYPNFRQFYG